MIHVKKIENRIIFKTKRGYDLGLWTPKILKLLGSTKSKTTKDKNCESVPHLEITEVVLIQCKIVNNNYQQNPRVLDTFVTNKSFAQLLNISPMDFIF